MDPVSIYGVAAATLQFADFAFKLFSTGWHAYRDSNGRSIEVNNLSVVYEDLAHLVKKIDAAARPSTEKRHSPDCPKFMRDINNVSEDIKRILPRTSRCFDNDLGSRKKDVAWLQRGRESSMSLSVGERFHIALEQAVKTEEIKGILQKLTDLRTRVLQELTTSIWFEVRDSKQWEQNFDRKLEEVFSAIDKLNQCAREIGPDLDKGHLESRYQSFTNSAAFTKRTAAEKQIARRIWDDKLPLDLVLSHEKPFPGRVSDSEIEAQIIETLYYEMISYRETAIVSTFRSTYEWMFSPDPLLSEQHEIIRQNVLTWLRATEEEQTRRLFWITGKPGSGKSVMMKFVANHQVTAKALEEWAQGSTLYRVSYHAWKPGVTLGKSVGGLMRSLLYQILNQCPGLTAAVCPRHWLFFRLMISHPERKCIEWSDKSLKESLGLLLKQAERLGLKLAIFIDGLDEFTEPPRDLCDLVMELAESPTTKVCVASRPWPQFSDAFAQCPTVELHVVTNNDISSYVHGRFEGVQAFLDLNNGYASGGSELLIEIVRRAQGVFLWVMLVTKTVFESLVDGAGLEELRQIVDAMPPELEGLYDAIFDSIPVQHRHDTAVMLRLFAVAGYSLPWPLFWVAIENANDPMKLPAIRVCLDDVRRFAPTLRRRLGARTRGILEFHSDPTNLTHLTHRAFLDNANPFLVGCLHRTGVEWLRKPAVANILEELTPGGFDPLTSLYHASISFVDAEEFSLGLEKRIQLDWTQSGPLDLALVFASLADGGKNALIVAHFSRFVDGLRRETFQADLIDMSLFVSFSLGMFEFVSRWYDKRPGDFDRCFSNQDRSTLLIDTVASARGPMDRMASPTEQASSMQGRFKLMELILSQASLPRPVHIGSLPGLLNLIEESKTKGDLELCDYCSKVEERLRPYNSSGHKFRNLVMKRLLSFIK